jgi:hypothetical protein
MPTNQLFAIGVCFPAAALLVLWFILREPPFREHISGVLLIGSLTLFGFAARFWFY